MQVNGIKPVRSYKKPRGIAGRPSIIAPNRLQRVFTVDAPNKVWVTDITYIRTWQGWLYLAVVVDLFARKVVGWSMKPSLSRELAMDALLMAVWRRNPAGSVLVHSDQGSQYGSDDFKRFCQANNLQPSMSRRANCWDYAVAESFVSSLKKERIRKRIYKTRDLTRTDIFDYIEVFYNRTRRHSHIGGDSPEAFETAGWEMSAKPGACQLSGHWLHPSAGGADHQAGVFGALPRSARATCDRDCLALAGDKLLKSLKAMHG